MSKETLSESLKLRPQPIRWLAGLPAALFLSCLIASAQQATDNAQAQVTNKDPKAASTSPQKPTASFADKIIPSADDHYRIGPGDILDIRILNRANLSRDNVRVEGDGTIRMPLIEGNVQAACLTETELSQELNKRYLKFYRNPQVDVFIKDYRSTQVAILGQVNEQSRFLLQRRVKLLELLTYAKGPNGKAGQTIYVIHSDSAFQCNKGELSKEGVATGLSTYKLSDTMKGDAHSNPYLENGDIVNLPEADEVYVVGNVMTPRTIALKEPITVSSAIAMSGGLNKDSNTNKVRIVRQEPGSTTKKEIFVDLGAIEKKRAEDIALLPNDIVDVPVSGTKSLLRSLIGGIAPAVSQMPVRVIP